MIPRKNLYTLYYLVYFSRFLRKKTEPWERTCLTTYNKVVKYLQLSHFSKRDAYETLRKTFSYAYGAYAPYKRLNGESIFQHVVKSLDYLMLVHPDIITIQLCILHEIFDRDIASREEVKELFGEKIVELLEHFTALRKVRYRAASEEQVENLRQMLLVLADDIRVILVKLATRLEGMSTLHDLSEEKRMRVATEILEIYGPTAARLGVYTLKTRLEDAAFEILYPERYLKIKRDLEIELENNKDIIDVYKQQIQYILRKHRIKGSVYGRIKSIYSIANKMDRKRIEHVGELYDIFALRVIVPTKEDCYRVFGYIHEQCFPIAHRIKDYISVPKLNQYQSLHTTVTGLYAKNPTRPVEIQIRTQWMDDIAEYGIASHSQYKEKKHVNNESYEEWQRRLAELNKDFTTKGRFLDNECKEIGQLIEKVFVLTTEGEIKALPKGATPVDFAYMLDVNLGMEVIGAKVNGKSVPLSLTLYTGDLVEIVRKQGHRPTGTSLLYVKTPYARKIIKDFLNEQYREEYVKNGKRMLSEELHARSIHQKRNMKEILMEYLHVTGLEKSIEYEQLLFQIGTGDISLKKIFSELAADHEDSLQGTPSQSSPEKSNDLIVGGNHGIAYLYAECCDAREAEILKEPLVAYISQKHEIRIHRADCKQVQVLKEDHESQILEVAYMDQETKIEP